MRQLGLKGVTNGRLLDAIGAGQFRALITNDKRMEREHNLSRRPFAILLLSTNHWPTIKPHVGAIVTALDEALREQFVMSAAARSSRAGSGSQPEPDVLVADVLYFGGPGRVRTVDLFHAMEARSQLRHRPCRLIYVLRIAQPSTMTSSCKFL